MLPCALHPRMPVLGAAAAMTDASLLQGVCKYIAAALPRAWAAAALVAAAGPSGDTVANAPTIQSSNGTAVANQAAAITASDALRKTLRASRGKLLLELVEALSGKAVNLKVQDGHIDRINPRIPSRIFSESRCFCSYSTPCIDCMPQVATRQRGSAAHSQRTSPGDRAAAATAALSMTEAVLAHLRSQGGLMNAVGPEMLLDPPDFEALMAMRAASAAGSAEQEARLESWAGVELSFEAYSTRAWNTILLQLMRLYVLARVTPAALREQLIAAGVVAPPVSSDAEPAPHKMPPGGRGQRGSTGSSAVVSKGPMPAAGVNQGQRSSETAAERSSGTDLPSDDVLSSSNVYSLPEACLLSWMSAHVTKAFPGTVRPHVQLTKAIPSEASERMIKLCCARCADLWLCVNDE